ncbi:MAG: tripartite tricarboxylate transporter permease [Candidatus Woesearchaeota archaeon]
MIEYLVPILLGLIAGTITGLLPGLHVNTIVSVILAGSAIIIGSVPIISISVFIISMAITHSITEFIPTALLGIPDSSTVVSHIPAHKLFSEGKSMLAITTSAFSSMIAGVMTIILYPLSSTIIRLFDTLIAKESVIIMLSFLVLLPLLLTKNRLYTILVIVLASIMGVLSLNHNFLLPLLSGLFGLPVLISSLRGESSNNTQESSYPNKIITAPLIGRLLIALCIGALFSYLPGAGSSAASLLAITIFPGIVKNPLEIIAVTSGLSTVNYVFSLYTYAYADRARNGAIVGIRELQGPIQYDTLLLFLAVAVIAMTLALLSTVVISRKAIVLLSRLDASSYKKISLGMIILTLLVILFLNGPMGLLFSMVCTIIGLIAINKSVQKVSMLSSLMVPTILLLLGVLG